MKTETKKVGVLWGLVGSRGVLILEDCRGRPHNAAPLEFFLSSSPCGSTRYELQKTGASFPLLFLAGRVAAWLTRRTGGQVVTPQKAPQPHHTTPQKQGFLGIAQSTQETETNFFGWEQPRNKCAGNFSATLLQGGITPKHTHQNTHTHKAKHGSKQHREKRS